MVRSVEDERARIAAFLGAKRRRLTFRQFFWSRRLLQAAPT
jgi:hypothetical protein